MKPRIFVGSSVEGLKIVDGLVLGLEHDAQCSPWTNAFPLAQSTIDPLGVKFRQNDFAIFVFSPDDNLLMREQEYKVARDNVLFEAGMFMGMQGKDRTFIIVPAGLPAFHLPTDLLGITVAQYDRDWAKRDHVNALAVAVAKIRIAIENTPWNTKRLTFFKKPAELGTNPGMTYPLKIWLKIVNGQPSRVLIQANGFEFASDVPCHPKAELRANGRYPFVFSTGKDPKDQTKDVFSKECFLEPHQSTTTWIPIDEKKITADKLNQLLDRSAAGILQYRTVWLGDIPAVQAFEDRL